MQPRNQTCRTSLVNLNAPQWLDTVAASGGRTHCLEAASHWFMESHPQATNELLDAWLDEQVGAR